MDCVLHESETGVVTGDTITLPDGSQHDFASCVIQPGSTLSFQYVEDPVDPISHPAAESPVAPVAPVVSSDGVSSAPAADAAPVASDAAPVTAAHTEQPDPTAQPLAGVGDLAKLGGDNPVAVVILAAVAVLGGGAAWKFYNQKSSQSHELKMKELELKSQSPSQSPPPCIVKHGELDLKLTELSGKISKLEHKTSGLSVGGSSVDEIEERLVKVEKSIKALSGKKAGVK